MNCPTCREAGVRSSLRVKETLTEGLVVRRRRICEREPSHRFNTEERMPSLLADAEVVRAEGDPEPFMRDRLYDDIYSAVIKVLRRPAVTRLVDDVTRDLEAGVVPGEDGAERSSDVPRSSSRT